MNYCLFGFIGNLTTKLYINKESSLNNLNFLFFILYILFFGFLPEIYINIEF